MARPEVKLPIPIAQHPRYATVLGQIAEMNAALMKVIGRKREIELRLVEHEPAEDRVSAHTQAALEFARTGVVRAVGNTTDSLHEEHLALRAQEESLCTTINARHEDLRRITRELSGDVSRNARARHAEICSRYGRLILDLDALYGEELDMLSQLEQLGYDVHLERYVTDPSMGRIGDYSSRIAALVREFPI